MIDADVVRGVIERAKVQIDAGIEPIFVYLSPEEYSALKGIPDNTYNYLVREVWGRQVERGDLPSVEVRIVYPQPVTGVE